MPALLDAVREYFWSKVDKSGGPDACWPWTGEKSADGYGRLAIANRCIRAHRIAYEFEFGDIPAGLGTCHSCDSPPCCNPAHLFAGTQQENMADMMAKGRRFVNSPPLRGEISPRAKLTPDIVRQIYAAKGSVRGRELASKFAVSETTIWSIWGRTRWRHILPSREAA